jgi:transcription elongation factor Elf1
MAELEENFSCSDCGALYQVTRTRFSAPVKDYADCVVCGCTLAKWNTTDVPLYRLIRTPDGEQPAEKPIA